MSIGAVVVNFNAGETIGRCLESLRSEERVTSLVVVDNASSDESWKLVPPEVLVRNSENVGFARAVNQGVRVLGSPRLILLINPDAWLTPGALGRLEAALEAEPWAGAAGPKNVYENGVSAPTGRRFPNTGRWLLAELRLTHLFPRSLRQRTFAAYWLPSEGPPLKVDWLFGSCLLMRRSVWEKVGGFDEDFFLFGEELDFFWRASRLGWFCIYVPEAVVVHVEGRSAATIFAPDQYRSMRWEGTLEACRRNMSRLHYLSWVPIHSLMSGREQRALRRAAEADR